MATLQTYDGVVVVNKYAYTFIIVYNKPQWDYSKVLQSNK